MKIFIFVVLLITNMVSNATPSQVIIIRHAEKPEEKSDSLSEKGFLRAQALTKIFEVHPELAEHGLPGFLFATKFIPGESSQRTYQTLQPLSGHLNVAINDDHRTEDYKDLAKDLLTNPKYAGRSVFISWTHTYIVQLAQALGSAPAEKWKSSVFDRLWVIRFDQQGRASSTDLPQRLLPKDSSP